MRGCGRRESAPALFDEESEDDTQGSERCDEGGERAARRTAVATRGLRPSWVLRRASRGGRKLGTDCDVDGKRGPTLTHGRPCECWCATGALLACGGGSVIQHTPDSLDLICFQQCHRGRARCLDLCAIPPAPCRRLACSNHRAGGTTSRNSIEHGN